MFAAAKTEMFWQEKVHLNNGFDFGERIKKLF